MSDDFIETSAPNKLATAQLVGCHLTIIFSSGVVPIPHLVLRTMFFAQNK